MARFQIRVIDLKSPCSADLYSVLDCDLCIIGSGPAGSPLAREFSDTKFRVTLLESGDFSRDPAVDALSDVENIGRPRQPDRWTVRNKIVGGGSYTWTGRCAPFDTIDFERRSWFGT